MPWKFDPQSVDLVFVNITTQMVESGSLDFGSEIDSDLAIDTGDRENDTSIVDNGLRIIDGSF
jgi:hypothetical protein